MYKVHLSKITPTEVIRLEPAPCFPFGWTPLEMLRTYGFRRAFAHIIRYVRGDAYRVVCKSEHSFGRSEIVVESVPFKEAYSYYVDLCESAEPF